MIGLYRINSLVLLAISTSGILGLGSLLNHQAKNFTLFTCLIAVFVFGCWIGGIISQREALNDKFFLSLLMPVSTLFCLLVGGLLQYISGL
jgi:hypothetical protein